MFARFARPIEMALGALFVVSAALKALNVYGFAVQVAAYGVVRDPSATLAIAYASIALEAALGLALLGGSRFAGFTIATTTALLVGFTALIAYAWAFKGLADCGCFGDYVKMGPAASIAKNVVLLAMAGAVWSGTRAQAAAASSAGDAAPSPTAGRGGLALVALGLAVVLTAFAMGKPLPTPPTESNTPPGVSAKDAPFAAFVPTLGGAPVPLAQGEFLVAMLSASCDHCRAATALLNDLTQTPGVPQIAALMMGTEEEMKDYMAAADPQFPIQSIDVLQFMDLLGDATAPPCFYIVRDGKEVRHFVGQDPALEQLLEFATKSASAHTERQQ